MQSELRTCRACNTEQTLENFPLTRGKRFHRCKSCITQKGTAWAAANRERVRRTKQAYIERHPERNREAKNRYARSEHGRQKNGEWKRANREYLNALAREQYREDPSLFIARLERREQREAIAAGEFTKQDEAALMEKQHGRCANPFCECDIQSVKYHVDHITPLVRGGSHWPENRQLLCVPCNHRKGTLTNDEWFQRQSLQQRAIA